jgi:hypothetical protein
MPNILKPQLLKTTLLLEITLLPQLLDLLLPQLLPQLLDLLLPQPPPQLPQAEEYYKLLSQPMLPPLA